MIVFSIIIPCFNSEKLINICIDKLLNLSFDKNLFEVIFVDDCSVDNTVKTIIDKTQNTCLKIKVLKNATNSGPGVCRRLAAELADGVFLCFCDSDDWYESDFLSNIEKEINKSGTDIVFFDMSYILNGMRVRKNHTVQFKYGDKLSYFSNCTESLCNMVVKRSLFLSIPIIDIRNGEDLALVPLLIAKATKITHIDKSYYNYAVRNDSVSLRKPTKKAYHNMILAFDHVRNHLQLYDCKLLDCVEFIGIKTVLYNATLMAIKGGNSNELISKIVSDFSQNYPMWYKNINIQRLNGLKIIYLWCIRYRLWCACRIFVLLHSFLLLKFQKKFCRE